MQRPEELAAIRFAVWLSSEYGPLLGYWSAGCCCTVANPPWAAWKPAVYPGAGVDMVDCGEKLNVAASDGGLAVGLGVVAGVTVLARVPSGGFSGLPIRPRMKARKIPPSTRPMYASCCWGSLEYAVPSLSAWRLRPSR